MWVLNAQTILFTPLRAFYKVKTHAEPNSSARFGIPLIWPTAGCNPCRLINNHDLYNFIHLSVVIHMLFDESKKIQPKETKMCTGSLAEKSNLTVRSGFPCHPPSHQSADVSLHNWQHGNPLGLLIHVCFSVYFSGKADPDPCRELKKKLFME